MVEKDGRILVILSIVAGLSFWVIDAALNFLTSGEGSSFLDLLIFDVPRRELYTRLVVLAVFIVFGVLVSKVLTERERGEESLRRTGQEQAFILDTVSELVTYQDTEMKISWANRAASESVGLAPERLVGRYCYEVWHQRSCPCIGCPVEKACETGQPQEAEITSPDGRVWFVRGYPVRDASGGIVGVVEVTLEITGRKRAEESLRESEKRYRSFIQNFQGIAYQGSINFTPLFFHGAVETITGYTEDEFLAGRPRWDQVIHPDDLPGILEKEEIRSVPDYSYEREYRIIRKDGQVRWVREIIQNLCDDSGKPILVQGVLYDITGHKWAEEEREKIQTQLLQVQKMEAIGRLAGGVAHDFNNLLTAITGYGSLLLNSLKEQGPLREDVEEIVKAARRAASLTRQLLAFSRQQVLQPRMLDLNDLVANLEKMLRRLIGEDIVLTTVLEPALGRVKADQGQIEQVVMNLTVNARDAMPQGGQLTIRTENVTLNEDDCQVFPEARPGRFVCLSVEDIGVGMDEETLQHIFEPFFTTRKEGTGLGLAVVFGIVKQHEGWINAYSEPGHGSLFRIYLPAFSIEPEGEAKEPILLQGFRGSGERILLVEDEEVVREFATKALDRSGYVVFGAASAQEALDIFAREKGRFHLVFSDVVLPDGTGLQLADQLLSRNPGLSVLLSSGYTDRKSQWQAIDERGFRFLQKPYVLADLLRAVREAVKPG